MNFSRINSGYMALESAAGRIIGRAAIPYVFTEYCCPLREHGRRRCDQTFPPAQPTYPPSGKELSMPTCSDCALYAKKTATDGECSINGPVPADRDAGRCPSRTFRPRG
jgi:hypothetical protein